MSYDPDLDEVQVARLPLRERVVHVWRRWVYPRVHRDGYIGAEIAYLENVMRGLESGDGVLEAWRRLPAQAPTPGEAIDGWCRRWVPETDGWEWGRVSGAVVDPDGRVSSVPEGWRLEWWMPVLRPKALDGIAVDL